MNYPNSNKPKLLLVLALSAIFLLLIAKPEYLKTGGGQLLDVGFIPTLHYANVGEIISLPLPKGITAGQVDIGLVGEKSLIDYVAVYESWNSLINAQAKFNNKSKDGEYSIFLSSKPQNKSGRATNNNPFRVFVLEHKTSELYEVPPSNKGWANKVKSLVQTISLQKATRIGTLNYNNHEFTFGQKLSTLISKDKLELPVSVIDSENESSSLAVRVEHESQEVLQLLIIRKSSELTKLKPKIKNKRANIRSPQLVAAIVRSQILGAHRIEQLQPVKPAESQRIKPAALYAGNNSSLPNVDSPINNSLTDRKDSSSSNSSELDSSSSSLSSQASSSSDSYNLSSSPINTVSNTCKCPYRIILIGGQGGDSTHPIFKDLSKVLKGAVNIPLNPGGGSPDDVDTAINTAKGQVAENTKNGYKTLVVGFSLGGAIAIKEFANEKCVKVYSIDPPIHMSPLYCNKFYGLFSDTCQILESAEKCIKSEPPNVKCYWCTAGKCFPIEEHDPFTYENKERIKEIIDELEELKKTCKD